MNHIYHSIWNEAFDAWIAASEIASGQGKRSKNRRKLLVTSLLLASTTASALPTGNELLAGQATVATPNTTTLQIDQASQNAIINWQGFSIAPTEAVNIQQPNANAALLNRVVGQDASQIQGQLNANGQVYLVNPNGVIFGKTAQVDVGGLVATTHDISTADFMNGKNHFTQNGATGKVENHGTIKTPEGGVVALIGEQVTNTGTINTPKGTTALAAGKTVDLDFQGDGLVEVKVTEAALNAQVKNQGAIQADGGSVVLTAKAANSLIDTVINQQGIIKAQGLVERNGEIILDGGDNGAVKVTGTLDTGSQKQILGFNDASTNQGLNSSGGNITVKGADIQLANSATINASGNTGGTITIGDKQITRTSTIDEGATVSTQTLDHGTAGTINVFANMDNGTVNIAGKLDASAPNNGDGGHIDTSAAHVKVADTAKISTKANNGNTGTWLIDPVDFTIAATGGNITGTTLSTALNNNAVTILAGNAVTSCTGATCTAGTGTSGDINVNDVINWSNNSTLTLNAWRNININANITGSGASSKLLLLYGQGGGATDNYFINGASVNLSAGQNFSTQKGTSAVQDYTVITSLGTIADATTLPNIMTLQGMNTGLAGNYVLGANINASDTASAWGTTGFMPVGMGITATNSFTGKFDGLGHSISGLTINRPTTDFVGLFGSVVGGSVSNVGLLGGSVTGYYDVGGLVGFNNNSAINNAYVTGSVTGTGDVGGLVGIKLNSGSINNTYATGNVTGTNHVGGLVGSNFSSTINNAYATGSVTGTSDVGGLVGNNYSATINNAYATGSVTGTSDVGGLVGSNFYSTINNAFWDTLTTGKDINSGIGLDFFGTLTNVASKTTTEMMQASTFASWGTDISATGGSKAVWRIYEGHTAPLLLSFLTSYTLSSASDVSLTYNGATQNGGSFTNITGILGTAASGKNVGVYNGYYSYQYDLVGGNLIINKATATVTANNAAKTYGQTVNFTGTEFISSGLVNNETIGSVALNSSGENSTAPVLIQFGMTHGGFCCTYTYLPQLSSPYKITASNASGGTFNPNNYNITYNAGLLTVNPATLTYTANPTSVTYGMNPLLSGSVSGFVNGETLAIATRGFLNFTSSATNLSNVGTYAVTGSGLIANNDNYNFVQAASNATALNIAPTLLDISANSIDKTVGQTVNFTGTEFQASGLQNGETVGSVILSSLGADKLASVLMRGGSACCINSYTIIPYTIFISNASGGTFNSSNYNLFYHYGILMVTPDTLNIIGNNNNYTVAQAAANNTTLTINPVPPVTTPFVVLDTLPMVTTQPVVLDTLPMVTIPLVSPYLGQEVRENQIVPLETATIYKANDNNHYDNQDIDITIKSTGMKLPKGLVHRNFKSDTGRFIP